MNNNLNSLNNIDLNYAIKKIHECEMLQKRVRELESDIIFFKKLVKLLAGDKVIVIHQDEIDEMLEPKFHLDENLNNDIIVKVLFG